MEHVTEIFDRYNTDKNSSFHNYGRQYDSLLKEYRNKNLKYLEVGVLNGESIKAMREVFKQSTLILGVDINIECKKYEKIEKGIAIEIGDATDKQFIDFITQKYGRFDIILDDGSHKNRDVIKTFEMLFPLLNDDGLYIIEDTICYKSPEYLDYNYKNHLEYFFTYTKFLNQWRYDAETGKKDHCVDPFKILKKTDNPFEYSIDKIEFGCSYIAVSKKLRVNWVK